MTAAEETWRPLGYDGNEAEYDALHDGVPKWMAPSFWQWIKLSIVRTVPKLVSAPRGTATHARQQAQVFDVQLLRKAERVLRFMTGYDSRDVQKGVLALQYAASKNEGLELRLADFLLGEGKDGDYLNTVLHESGSMWRVGIRVAGKPGLIRRVPEGVQLLANSVMSSASQSGKRLAQAWEEVFGINPDPSNAYSLAVKAVEDAAIPIVVPSKMNATLGDVIRQLETDSDWRLPLTREDNKAPTAETITRMCRALWKGHRDRHGGGRHSTPEVKPEEAETAVTLAVPLVHWFASGMVARR